MSLLGQSLISLAAFKLENFNQLFERASVLGQKKSYFPLSGSAAHIFFENSTRTKLSFEQASLRSGLHPFGLDASSGSSLAKGESEVDTVLNIAAMQPDLLIIRSGDQFPMKQMAEHLDIPIINAGWGMQGHPTQALLDIFTIWKERELQGLKLLVLGDVYHSRVAASHFEAFEKLGIQIAVCGPRELKPDHQITWFDKLSDALDWAEVVMALRVQLERHSDKDKFDAKSYHQEFGLNSNSLKKLHPKALLLHPGPVNWGVELAAEVSNDPRSRILKQVENGVLLRTALIQSVLGRFS